MLEPPGIKEPPMKSIRLMTLAVAVLLVILWLPRTAAAQADDVQGTDARRIAAMVVADAAALGPLLADDLTYTHSNGLVETKEHFLASISSKAIQYQSLVEKDVRLQVYGDAVVMTGGVDIKAVFQGKPVALPARFTAVYVRQSGSWRLAAWQTTRLPDS
jgi:ketosteroid isomerase-like protein